VRNAFNAQMIFELTEAFSTLASSDARVIQLSGLGPSFSAGADVTWMRESLGFTFEENLDDAHRMSDMFGAIDACPKPVVGRVHGAALGGGMGLLAVCDVVVADHGTVFGFTETRLGIIPAVISRFVLPKIGETWARALFTTGERFGTQMAQRIGLVHWVAPEGELDQLTDTKIEELLKAGPVAVQEAKSLIAAARGHGSTELREMTSRRIATLRTSPEGQEGLSAFLDRRKPAWNR
jgi:methylglutaconyl-CoA hydratase